MGEFRTVQADCFKRAVHKLERRFPNISQDVLTLQQGLSTGRTHPGVHIFTYNQEWTVWKIRMACRDLKKGKSGGMRVIYIRNDSRQLIFMISIYYKGEKENMPRHEILALIEDMDPDSSL